LVRARVDWYGAGQGHGFIIPEVGGPKASVRREDLVAGEENLENSNEVFRGTEGLEARNVSRT
jgi:cold shock CspA family protein